MPGGVARPWQGKEGERAAQMGSPAGRVCWAGPPGDSELLGKSYPGTCCVPGQGGGRGPFLGCDDGLGLGLGSGLGTGVKLASLCGERRLWSSSVRWSEL